MSTLKTNNVQVGQSVTATNNFTLYQPPTPDGTVRIGVGNSGATTSDVVVIGSSGITKGVISSGTAVTASGTSVDFTGIPSTAKRITVMFNGVSGSALATVFMRVGTSSGVVSSGYLGNATYLPTAGATVASTYWPLDGATLGATSLRQGTFTLVNITGNTWCFSGASSDSTGTGASVASGAIVLSAPLDRVSIGISSGTFDAGSINILYEG